MFITEQEIMSQHLALAKTTAYLMENKEKIQKFFDENKGRKLVFMGCGSSYMLSKAAQQMFSCRENTNATAIAGGDYLVNPKAYEKLFQDSVVIALSRSGLTSEIVRGVKNILATTNATCLSVTMKEENDLLPLSGLSLILPWAYDNSVCQTRTVTNLYTITLMLDAFRSRDEKLEKSVLAAVEQDEAFMLENRKKLEELAAIDFERAVVLADGPLSGLGEEAALAFTEIAMIKGAAFNFLDYRHGPIVLQNQKTMTLVAVQPAQNTYQQDMLDDLKKTGCILVTLSGEETTVTGVTADFKVKGGVEFGAYGILFAYMAQMIALTKALKEGINPDKPKGLDAYIVLR